MVIYLMDYLEHKLQVRLSGADIKQLEVLKRRYGLSGGSVLRMLLRQDYIKWYGVEDDGI